MKKLNKLEINSEKLIKKEELMTLRGGYGGMLKCEGGEYGTCYFYVLGCSPETDKTTCDLCPGGWTSAICVG